MIGRTITALAAIAAMALPAMAQTMAQPGFRVMDSRGVYTGL